MSLKHREIIPTDEWAVDVDLVLMTFCYVSSMNESD